MIWFGVVCWREGLRAERYKATNDDCGLGKRELGITGIQGGTGSGSPFWVLSVGLKVNRG